MATERNKTSKPVIPFVQLYDHAGAQIFTSAGAYHTWDTVSFKTSDIHYTADEDAVFINNPGTGYYEVTFECSYSTATVGQNVTTTQLYINGSGIEGSKSVLCIYYAGGQGVAICGTQTMHFALYLKAGDRIQIKTSTNIGCGVMSYPDSSRLLIKFIPVKGWNNNSGGNINYRGDVLR